MKREKAFNLQSKLKPILYCTAFMSHASERVKLVWTLF